MEAVGVYGGFHPDHACVADPLTSAFYGDFFVVSKHKELGVAVSEIQTGLADKIMTNSELQNRLEVIASEQNICILITDSALTPLFSAGKNSDSVVYNSTQAMLETLSGMAEISDGGLKTILNKADASLKFHADTNINAFVFFLSNYFSEARTNYRLVSVTINQNTIIFMDTSVR